MRPPCLSAGTEGGRLSPYGWWGFFFRNTNKKPWGAFPALRQRSGELLRNGTSAVGPSVRSGLGAISQLGGAKPGDRTMLDALDPFVKALKKWGGVKASREAVLAAVEAAERASKRQPR
jgi:hypothetical protein